jgi:Fuc2NAc and GlcNAc transferase
MIVPLLTLVVSTVLCGLYLLAARRLQILDQPNERSSHQQPTPHGGGAPLFLAFSFGVAVAALWWDIWTAPYLLLMMLALALMLLGVVDDFRELSVRLRMALYGLVALLMSAYLLQPMFGGAILLAASLFWGLVLLWSLNLFNFMDGIDGIAATQCVLACGSAALLAWVGGGHSAYALFCLLLAAAHLGFLAWNWPPARLFMGDAGSVPTGFLLASLALLGWVEGQLNPLCWLVLLAAFVTDASWTLLWRIASGQPFTQPHRSHAYQRLSRHMGSHLVVDMGLVALNGLWLFPLAWGVQIWPKFGFLLVILAYLPLVWGMAKVRKLA